MSQSLVRPVSARSAMLTMLIGGPAGAHDYTAADLVAFTGHVGIAESTARAALSRLLSTGDLLRSEGAYVLSDRLRERQRRQRLRLAPQTRRWSGDWELVVVTATGRSAADRAALRAALVEHRLSELREGAWMRPDNLPPWPGHEATRRLATREVDDPEGLAAELFRLDQWVSTGSAILAAVRSAGDEAERFAACVAGVRHLLTDPALPGELLPGGWPASDLRAEYDASLRWMATLVS
jgi:phenylacetic acid degradation operon negative regulatory protein